MLEDGNMNTHRQVRCTTWLLARGDDMNPRSRARGWLAVGLSLVLLLAACVGNGGGIDRDGAQPSRTTLTLPGWPPIGNPISEYTSLSTAVFMPLIWVDDQGEIFSDMLESWEVSDDARTVTLTLKPDIEWNDGTPISSADVLMSLTMYLDSNISVHAFAIRGVEGQAAFADGKADSISGLSAPDARTVVIELEQPDAAWLPNFANYGVWIPVLPHHVLGEVPHEELLEHEFFETYPVSDGPYQFVEYVTDLHTELKRNPNWSLGEAGFERVFITADPEDVQSARLETGEVQFIYGVAPADVERIRSISGVEVQSVGSAAPVTWQLMFHEPLLDPRVRQAMVYAVDREGICEGLLEGYCTVPLTNLTQIGPEWAIPTDDMIEYRYDPDRARELLNEAGWDPGTELTFFTEDKQPQVLSAIAIIQDNMADVGINWKVNNIDFAALEEKWAEGDLDGFWAGGGDFTVDPSAVQGYTECDGQYPNGSNITRYCDPELDELWAAGRLVVDQEERAEIYHEAFRLLNEDPVVINVYVPELIVAYDARLKGVKPHPSDLHQWNIGEWYWEG
jgi:peptide/nickel transport system substrate-binding protein